MADNTQLDVGSGGDVIATDDIGGIKHQRVKVQYGDDGSATDASAINRFPVEASIKDSFLDAFGRLRVAQPFTVFDSKQIYDNQPLVWQSSVTGTGSAGYLADEAATQLIAGTASGDKTIRQTKRYFNYQPGKSFLVLMTGTMDTPKTNNVQRIGYFDDNNGLFFEQDGSNLNVVRRSRTTGSVDNTAIEQDSWNLDPLDGTGPSGITLDVTKTQIYVIDMQWLGVGRVRFGFVIDGVLIYAHELYHANYLTRAFMATPNLPLRYENENTGVTSGATTMKHICASIMSEGGYEPVGVVHSADRGITETSIGTTLEPVISIRLRSGYVRATVSQLKASVMSATNANFRYAVLLNPTVTGGTAASWTSVSNSAIEYDIARDGTVSGGELLASGYVSNNVDQIDIDLESALGLAADIAGTADILVLAVQTISGNDDFYGSFSWRDQF